MPTFFKFANSTSAFIREENKIKVHCHSFNILLYPLNSYGSYNIMTVSVFVSWFLLHWILAHIKARHLLHLTTVLLIMSFTSTMNLPPTPVTSLNSGHDNHCIESAHLSSFEIPVESNQNLWHHIMPFYASCHPTFISRHTCPDDESNPCTCTSMHMQIYIPFHAYHKTLK